MERRFFHKRQFTSQEGQKIWRAGKKYLEIQFLGLQYGNLAIEVVKIML
jgi:hypothetical protein